MDIYENTRCELFLMIALCIITLNSCLAIEPAEEEQIENALSTFAQKARQKRADWEVMNAISTRYGVALIPYIEQHLQDPDDNVRYQMYASMVLLAVDSNDTLARQRVVDNCLLGMRDDNWIDAHLAKWLLRFRAVDFSDEANQLLREQFSRALSSLTNPEIQMHPDLQKQTVLLVGVADMKSELPQLKQLIQEREGKLKEKHERYLAEKRHQIENMSEYMREHYAYVLRKQYWQKSLVWAALRARARMGVKENIGRCIELVESHPDEDYRVVRLLNELSYVRQPEVVDYLHTYLKSDKLEAYKGSDVVRSTYAQYAAKALAQILRGFPGRKDIGGNKQTIERCRKWMAQQKEWDIIR